MKITLYMPDLQLGGAERMFVNLANNFASRGFFVDLVLNKRQGHYLDEVSSQVNVIELGVENSRYAIPKFTFYLLKNRPDRILSTLFHANLVSIISCALTGNLTRCYIRQENVTKEINKSKSLRSRIYFMLTKLLYPFANGFIGISKGVVDDFVGKGLVDSKKSYVVHNPAITDSIDDLSKANITHPWFSSDYYTFINVSRLNIAKNQSLLIRAFRNVVGVYPRSRLLLVGEGELREDLEKLSIALGLENYIDFVGSQKNPFSWMKKSDCFVFSSSWEGFGNVLVEALYCCGNVISTDCPSGPSEILENGKYGVLVPVDDEDALTFEMIRKVKEDCSKFIGDCPSSYMRFHIDVISEKYLQVLRVDEVS
ncbi:glycosyltransferase [Vibrio alginolyticus]|uniref:glycosyltransferase n=1 Tax=Vibrio alginolyticus TaxID=663 RepID=UPI001BD45B6D|nr:glycosyltransferase [Vibrio alginolyticus]EME9802032.1 glycosyltransferase [Vibrio alginolyticus]MBS9837479.1 glycosyltransferase [Vibrio alginolyticus]